MPVASAFILQSVSVLLWRKHDFLFEVLQSGAFSQNSVSALGMNLKNVHYKML